MSASGEFVEYVADMLSSVGHIQVSRMFGGALLKVEGNQLGVLFKDTAYFKVFDLELQEKYRRLGSKQFTYFRKDKIDPVVIKNWWTVPAEALDNEHELVVLAEEVLCQYADL